MIEQEQMERMQQAVAEIRRTMAEAAIRAGRKPEEILLCAACKTRTVEEVRASAELPIDIFGENHVQELVEKTDAGAYLGKPGHFIGHLQTNKVKYIVGKAKMIHSVDSLHLAEKINSESEKRRIVTDCLAEINSGCEESKFGLTFSESLYIIKEMAGFKNIRLRGLMTVAPVCQSAEDNREIFKKMKDTFLEIKKDVPSFDTLSMGMSADFTVAVEEGASIVRVGTAIFGERNYTK